MKHILFLFLTAAILSATLTSCDNNSGNSADSTDTTAATSGVGFAALKPSEDIVTADIPSPYEGMVVYTTDTHVISESDGKYILYKISGDKVRTLTDFSDVSYIENGETCSHAVLLTAHSAYTLGKDGLESVGEALNNPYFLGDYIISAGKLYTGNFKRIGNFSYGETKPYAGFSDGAVLTGISRFADTAEIPHGGEISSETSIFYLETIDSLPNDAHRLCSLYFGELFESAGRLYLLSDGSAYRFPVVFEGEIKKALDDHSGILIHNGGNVYILMLTDISPGSDSALYVKSTLSRIILDGAFNKNTVLKSYVLDSNGEVLIAGNNSTFDIYGDLLAEFRYTYSEGDSSDLEFALYDKDLHELDGSPYSHMYRSRDRIIAFSRANKCVMIYSQSGELLYESEKMHMPILIEEFGAAVVTSDFKIQFISFDGKASETLDGWNDEFINIGVSSSQFPTYIEQYSRSYYPVCFTEASAYDNTSGGTYIYFWFDPQTGHAFKEIYNFSS